MLQINAQTTPKIMLITLLAYFILPMKIRINNTLKNVNNFSLKKSEGTKKTIRQSAFLCAPSGANIAAYTSANRAREHCGLIRLEGNKRHVCPVRGLFAQLTLFRAASLLVAPFAPNR